MRLPNLTLVGLLFAFSGQTCPFQASVSPGVSLLGAIVVQSVAVVVAGSSASDQPDRRMRLSSIRAKTEEGDEYFSSDGLGEYATEVDIDLTLDDMHLHAWDASDILDKHDKVVNKRLHSRNVDSWHPTIGFVAPWNKEQGYNTAKNFRGKFTHLAPVWYSIHPDLNDVRKYKLFGHDEVDQDWLKEVREPVAQDNDAQPFVPKIVPRFMMEGFTNKDASLLATTLDHNQAIAKLIVDECQKYKYDGFVLDFIYVGFTDQFVRIVSYHAKSAGLEVYVNIPSEKPGVDVKLFDHDRFDLYKKWVDGFTLVTYDFSNPINPGPNSPVEWIKDNVLRLCPEVEHRRKLLVALNMYGVDYADGGASSVTSETYLDLLAERKDVLRGEWKSKFAEHMITYKDEEGSEHEVWYPTVDSVKTRLQLIWELGVGVTVWEIGQGLDYFYELL
ncbi:glycoside hydrolase superfamily [Chytriomyces sp. MP71]|nr:glycoside hydrolase superfamily [Chytriomyces sp. MP71]